MITYFSYSYTVGEYQIMFYILVNIRVSDYLLPKNVTECRGCGSTLRLIGSKSDIRPFASVVLESTSCLTQYRIMVMTSTRIVMIMHSIGHTCPFGRDSMILWGKFLIIFAGRTRVMHGLYVCDCGAVADCTGSEEY